MRVQDYQPKTFSEAILGKDLKLSRKLYSKHGRSIQKNYQYHSAFSPIPEKLKRLKNRKNRNKRGGFEEIESFTGLIRTYTNSNQEDQLPKKRRKKKWILGPMVQELSTKEIEDMNHKINFEDYKKKLEKRRKKKMKERRKHSGRYSYLNKKEKFNNDKVYNIKDEAIRPKIKSFKFPDINDNRSSGDEYGDDYKGEQEPMRIEERSRRAYTFSTPPVGRKKVKFWDGVSGSVWRGRVDSNIGAFSFKPNMDRSESSLRGIKQSSRQIRYRKGMSRTSIADGISPHHGGYQNEGISPVFGSNDSTPKVNFSGFVKKRYQRPSGKKESFGELQRRSSRRGKSLGPSEYSIKMNNSQSRNAYRLSQKQGFRKSYRARALSNSKRGSKQLLEEQDNNSEQYESSGEGDGSSELIGERSMPKRRKNPLSPANFQLDTPKSVKSIFSPARSNRKVFRKRIHEKDKKSSLGTMKLLRTPGGQGSMKKRIPLFAPKKNLPGIGNRKEDFSGLLKRVDRGRNG